MKKLVRGDFFVPGLLTAANLGLALAAIGRFGWFRDELYYVACSDHLAAGFVDHPPLSIFILKLVRLFFGDSLASVRLLPALGSAAFVLLAALIARELGGGGGRWDWPRRRRSPRPIISASISIP